MKFKKIISIIISISMLLTALVFNINANIDYNEPTIDFDEVHAILTEKYLFEYTIDSEGNIITSPDSIEVLSALSNDIPSIKKIIFDKSTSTSKPLTDKKLLYNEAKKCSDAISNLKYYQLSEKKIVISDHKIINGVKSLSNFTKSIQENNRATLQSGGIALSVLYKWTWNYSPLITLSDIVSIVWSDSFDSNGSDVRFKYKQYGYRRITQSDGSYTYDYSDTTDNVNLDLSGSNAFTDATPSVGFQKRYNIQSVFYSNGKSYYVSKHYGYIRVKVVRYTIPQNDDGAITFCGDYFHQKVTPNFTLDLSPTGASLSVTALNNYDKAPSCVKTITY